MNRFISQKFRFYSFVCIAMLVFVHGYNLNDTYLRPFSAVEEPMTFTTWFEYFMANGILRFRIPLLFLISGYIFAMQDKKPYGQRIKKRFTTLMIPYFIWSAIGIGMTLLWEQSAVTAQAVAEAKLDQLGDPTPYSQMPAKDLLIRWTLTPISFQLWFIRVLFLYNVLYPAFRWLVKKIPLPWFIITFGLFFLNFNFMYIVEGQGLFFFTLGIWLNKKEFSLQKEPGWFSQPLGWLFFIGTSVIKTFMAFELEPYSYAAVCAISALYAASVIAGIIAVWFGLDKIVHWFITKKWFQKISTQSFVIYGLHVPLVFFGTRLLFHYLDGFIYYRLLTYLLAPLLTLLFCVAVGLVLKKLVPPVYRVMTGGRGF